MSKTFTDLTRHALNGATMGTRWSVLFHHGDALELDAMQRDFQSAVDEVDQQMSTWKPDSDLNQLNAALKGEWLDLPAKLLSVIEAGLAVGAQSGGAFDIGMVDAVEAWGFHGREAGEEAIRAAFQRRRAPAHDMVEIDRVNQRLRKHADLTLDLNGIAKGFGADELARVAERHGIRQCLVAIDGELRALGRRPDGTGWPVAIEQPQRGIRAVHSLIELEDAAIATSGDYRHFVDVNGRSLSHTMDPARGRPLADSPASATVIARDCMIADAWATAMMVLGEDRGLDLARTYGLSVLFLRHGNDQQTGCGCFAA